MSLPSRRLFVRSLGAVSLLNLNPRAAGANEKVTVALIGGRNQGKGVALRAIAGGAEVKTFCDIDDSIVGKVSPELAAAQGRAPAPERDFRRVLDDKDIQAVIIATPDHWHTRMAILACQAGKDVYVEKPLSQTIGEGHLIRQAARKYNRVMQVGNQRRSGEHFRQAIDYVASGKLGKLCLIKAWVCQTRPTIGRLADGPVPAGIDYDLWLGPAPARAFNPNRFHYNWRFFWDYGNTELGNQGVHMLDIAIWGVQALRGFDNCLPTRISDVSGIYWLDDAKEVPDTQVVSYDYGSFQLTWELRSFGQHLPAEGSRNGTAFYGSEAALVVNDETWSVHPRGGKPAQVVTAPDPNHCENGMHEKNFLECVKSRKRPNSDVEIGRLSTTLCHLGNVSCRLKRSVHFDPKTETFGDDQEANAFLRKTYRSPYTLPEV